MIIVQHKTCTLCVLTVGFYHMLQTFLETFVGIAVVFTVIIILNKINDKV